MGKPGRCATVDNQIAGFNSIWAFAHDPPAYHPLPRQTPFTPIRRLLPIKAVDLVYNAHKLIGIAPFSPPYKVDNRPYPRLRALGYHFFWMMIGFFMFDLSTYFPFRLSPKTFGSTDYIGGDLSLWCRDLSKRFGVPVLVVRAFMTASLAGTAHFGMSSLYHMFALIGIGSGYHSPEEWPVSFRWPILSTSLCELWGKRWHQFMTVCCFYQNPIAC